jgi:uncharacterized repeat protein (TIGR01451 family)
MNKFMSFLKRHAKKLALVSVVSVAAIGATTVAWGPDRQTYTVNTPADHITFNSIVDNPNVGDEREFVSIKDAANTNDGGWRDTVAVEPGKEYLVRIYAHNNAASSLNLKAVNTRVSASVPTTTGKSIPISGFVTADNAQPKQVWDDIRLTSTKDFNLAFVPGSARIYNNGYAAGGNGQPLPDSIVTSAGAKIGYNGPNGEVPGCFQYANYIYFKVKPQFAATPKYEVQKTVRKQGEKDWKESVNAKLGDTVEYQIRYANTGPTTQNSVVVVDKLPAGITYVPDSTYLMNSNHPNGDKAANQTGIINGGLSIGNYAPAGVGYVKFSARVTANANQLKCGPNTMKNWAYGAPAGSPASNDDADVNVSRVCENQLSYQCTGVDVANLGGNKYQFKVNVATQGNVTVNKYTYNFGDGSEELSTTNATVEHQYAAPGTYDINVRVLFNVGSEQKDARCTAQVTIPTTPETPVEELPNTGAGSVVAGIFGTSALAYGIYAFADSRRALKNLK